MTLLAGQKTELDYLPKRSANYSNLDLLTKVEKVKSDLSALYARAAQVRGANEVLKYTNIPRNISYNKKSLAILEAEVAIRKEKGLL
jgi:hypothetical protein